MTTRVFLRPDAATIAANNGIGRVVHAQYKHLPRFGVELVGGEDQADVVAGHTHEHGAARVDVVHLHGLYWTGDKGSGVYNNWHHEANARIIAACRRAKVITVPSEWVGVPFKRDMRVTPLVIGHGLDLAEWGPGHNLGYALWGKNRLDDVCNPRWPYELARHGAPVVTTFVPKDVQPAANLNLRVTGALPAAKMKELLLGAEVYLATTKETFGIQTLEALACGVPVLGFAHGGTADLVTHLHDGYLVAPGDVDGLMEGLAYIRAHRAAMSAAALQTARKYTWERAAEAYARLYHDVARNPAYRDTHTVAVVIPCHNYGQYLAECLDSVLAQTYRPDEIVVVDDASTDDSAEVAARYAERGVRLIRFERNQGVAAARNAGIDATTGQYVVCLDADDLLDPRYVAACRAEMVADRGLGLTWTGLSVLRPGQPPTGNVWTGPFDWGWQASVKAGDPPHTTIPTGAMFRRALYERAGGYQQVHAPGEDAEFYTRGLSVGFTAKKATELPFFLYRDHGGGAHKTRVYKPIDTWHPWMRDHAYPLGAPSAETPAVRSYSEPKVSVVVPVGPGHAHYLPEALESLVGQTMREWEVIVVDDYDDDLTAALSRFPFVKRATSPYVAAGPGAARNHGLTLARAPLVLFLDADDVLDPRALARMCAAYADAGGRYIYGDWQELGGGEVHRLPEYEAQGWRVFPTPTMQHAVTVLMATDDARRLKFDETLPVWEDWDFFLRAALVGVHGRRLPEITLHVRKGGDSRTARGAAHFDAVAAQLQAWYQEVTMGSCCGGNGAAVMAAKQAAQGVLPEIESGLSIRRTIKGNGAAPLVDTAMPVVRLQFTGQRTGAVTYRGKAGREYRGGNNPQNRFINAHPEDVDTLLATGHWQRVGLAVTATPPPPRVAPSEPPPMPPAPAPIQPAVPYSAAQAVEAPEPAADQIGPAVTVHGPVADVTLTNRSTGNPAPVSVNPSAAPPAEQVIQAGEETVKRKRHRPASKNTNIRTDLNG